MPDPAEKWYGLESHYTETDETYIDDDVPVFDRGEPEVTGNPAFGYWPDDCESN